MIGFTKVTQAFVSYQKPITIHNNITKITIPSNSYNEMSNLNLKGFSSLKELEIGDNCFGKVDNMILNELNDLKSLVVGSNSLFNTTTVVIENLPLLEEILIKEDGLYCNGSNSSLTLRGTICYLVLILIFLL